MKELIGYHSTKLTRYKKILKKGFDPIKYAYQHPNPKIKRMYWTWFTESPQFTYGKVCLKVNLTGLECVVNEGCCIICKEAHIEPNRIMEVMTQ